MTISVVPVLPCHTARWCEMRCLLWPEGSQTTHRREIKEFFAGHSLDPSAVLIAQDKKGTAQGFVELTIRSHAEGCTPGRIAYLEGWYVDPGFRGKGVGRMLLKAAEEWAKQNRCRELASDAWSKNTLSRKAHLAMGFKELGTIRCFRKVLRGARPPVSRDVAASRHRR